MKKASGITDFHAHILPGADHGSDGADTSLSQLRMLVDNGVKTIVATPHFYPECDSVEGFLKRRKKSERLLCEAVSESGEALPEICVGAEVLVCAGMQHMDALAELCIEGTNVILLEMPDTDWTDDIMQTVCDICSGELYPVLAHPSRYNKNEVERLYGLTNIPFQLNARDSLHIPAGITAGKWLDDGRVCAAGSDIHGAHGEGRRRAEALQVFWKKNGEAFSEKTNLLLEGARRISGLPLCRI